MIVEIRKSFESGDPHALRRLATELARRAAVDQDEQCAQLSVIAYSLSKILTKNHFQRSRNWKKYREIIISALRDAERGAKGNVIKYVENTIRRIDAEDGHFVKNIVDKARSKMAAVAHAVGISRPLAAELFDSDIHDLFDYVGKMRIHDEDVVKTGIRERVNALRRLVDANSG